MKNKEYSDKDIKVLSDREHVRLRTSIYLGNTTPTTYSIPLFINDQLHIKEIEFIPAIYKALGEIIDNSIDEFAQTYSKSHKLIIESDPETGEYSIEDNGRGIPINMHETGKYTPEVALGSLRAGRNFGDDKEAGVIGMNGVGSACTNYLSKYFHVDINREGKNYSQTFKNGAKTVSKPIIKKGNSKTGTKISFKLDQTILKNTSLPSDLVRNRALELAFTNPSLSVQYNDETFRFRKGLDDIVGNLIKNVTTDEAKSFKFDYKDDKGTIIEFFVIFGINNDIDEKIFTWVNSSLLFDGGICNTQFLNAFSEKCINHLQKEAKKQKCVITKNDIRQGLLVFGNMKLSDPQYDAQSKTRLTGPPLRREFDQILETSWKSFVRKNKEWFDEVLERAYLRHHSNANKKAIDAHKKSLRKRVPGLDDANNKNRSECQLLITEGLSAAGQILDVRNAKIHASFALTGKINNIFGCTPAQVLQMGKLTNMLAAIGLIPGKVARRSDLRFGKVVISTDADFDGDDIFSLLINLFYQFWPELFKEPTPYFYRLVVPNVVAVKGKIRKHFVSMAEFDKVSDKYKNWDVMYYKGLGSMFKEDWQMILGDSDTFLLPIIYDEGFDPCLKLLFSDDASSRKDWLQ